MSVRKMFNTGMNLRQNKSGHQLPWSDEELAAGFKKFYDDHGHYPSAGEIDMFAYLPSARSIQRTHGGLVALRERLLPGEDADHTKGERRKRLASEADARARKYEEEFYLFLIKHFQEISVHEQKVVRPGNVACDIFVYLNGTDRNGIVIDLFYAQDLITLLKIVTIKAKRYVLIGQQTYFVLVGNDTILQSDIDARIANRKLPLPAHITVVTEQAFKYDVVNKLKQLSDYVLQDGDKRERL